MEFHLGRTILVEDKDNETKDYNTYHIISKENDIEEKDFENVIQIIDESGKTLSCTYDKFVEIFDNEGLSGFVL